MPKADLELSLCQELSGITEMPRRLVASVMKRARAKHPGAVDSMLTVYGKNGLAAVMKNDSHSGVARAVLYCLYTGLMPDATGERVEATGPTALTADDHFQALMWRVIQAHPPALSGGYFGHWHYPPEDA